MCGKPIGSHKPLQLNGKNLIVPKILRIPSFLNFKLSRFYVILRFRQSCLLGSAFYLGLNFPPPFLLPPVMQHLILAIFISLNSFQKNIALIFTAFLLIFILLSLINWINSFFLWVLFYNILDIIYFHTIYLLYYNIPYNFNFLNSN